MSIILATILAIAATPGATTQDSTASAAQSAATPTGQAAAPAVPRSGRELADAAHAAMRQWAKATDQEADAAARELLGIYREIQQDTRLARSQREPLRLAVRARLDQLCLQIAKRIAKDKAAAQSKVAQPNSAVPSVAANNNQQPRAALAQVGLPAGGAGAGPAAGQNPNADNGQALVDLIQAVICPKSWDVNGGACTIFYWQPQRAIVVRAGGDVHEQISDTIEQLNRANH